MNKNADAGNSPYRNKGTHSGTGMIRYWTEIQDAFTHSNVFFFYGYFEEGAILLSP
jgi:hypothetical protein